MAALNFNRTNWFSFLQFFHHHGFLFLFMLSFTAAQPRSPSTPEPPMQFDPLTPTAKFNPSLAILMVIIVGAFFLMGFFSIYVRRCAERRYGGGTILNPMVGVGRWSRRGQQGLDAAVINTFPTFLYSTVKGHKIGKDLLECAVCLNEFEDDETLRLIPKCSHVFHPDCIDAWLVSNTTCPVCRANLVPTPGDSSFDSTSLFEPDDNSVEPQLDRRYNNMADESQNNPELQQPQSPNIILLNSANQNRPPRSRSTGWRFGNLFPRSHSTGHSLVQPGENLDRFTLRLPEEIRSQLLNTHLDRTKSCVTFTRAMSSRRGYRSRSSRNYYERFDRGGRADRWGFTKSPPFIGRTGSVRSSNRGTNEVNESTPKSLLKSVKSPFDRLFLGVDDSSSNNENGERSSDKLRASALDSQV